jgi:Tfp pilus assembly protein PilE
MKMKILRSKKSVTLIELVMVIIIVGVLAGASSMYIKETIDLWRFLSFRNEITAQGRMSLMRMEREIRQVKDKNSIATANASRFQFTDISNNTIDYQLSGNNLNRTFNGTPNILANGVTNLTFCYYKNDNNPCEPNPADLTSIYRIAIKMDITFGSQTKHLETEVWLRNLS